MRKRRIKRIFIVCGALLLLYIASYVVLSAMGSYRWSQSGRLRYSFGLSVTDIEIWSPRGMTWEPFRNIYGADTTRGDLLGYLYSPLIALDRAWLHPTIKIFEQGNPKPN